MKKTKQDSLQTRADLLAAALEVFYQNGAGAAFGSIAAQAGVTRGALYWHFKNKEDLFDALLQQYFQPFLQLFDESALHGVTDILEHWRQNLLNLCALIEQDEQHRKFTIILHTKLEHTEQNQNILVLLKKYDEQCERLFLNTILRAQQQQKLPENLDIELSSLFLKSNFVGMFQLWAGAPERFGLRQTAEKMLDASIASLQNNPHLRSGIA